MTVVKLGLLLTATVALAACAHQQTSLSDSSAQSVGWPIDPIYDHPAAEFPRAQAKNEIAAAVDEATVDVAPPVQTEMVKTETVKPASDKPAIEVVTTDSRFRMPEVKPSAIKIPGPKYAESAYEAPLIFDIPVAYNSRVKYWIEYFQTNGRSWYTKWLERSSRYLPLLQRTLRKNGLPRDLAYIAMIESGFSSQANSSAKAVGPWQFIRETGKRYGLKVTWWLDERRDFQKSTVAAAKYLKKMYSMFHNWYLVAAGYNTGEYRIERVIRKNGTKNFWKIAARHDLEAETRDYVPKLIAALLIAKAPQMYGFKHIHYDSPLTFDHFRVPGGTRLDQLADAIGVTTKYMEELNPELVRGYVPSYVEGHLIRIPKGSAKLVSRFVRGNLVSER